MFCSPERVSKMAFYIRVLTSNLIVKITTYMVLGLNFEKALVVSDFLVRKQFNNDSVRVECLLTRAGEQSFIFKTHTQK